MQLQQHLIKMIHRHFWNQKLMSNQSTPKSRKLLNQIREAFCIKPLISQKNMNQKRPPKWEGASQLLERLA